MEQKIVIKICMPDHKSRSKAMQTAVSVPGVASVALPKEDQMEVKGIGVDATELVNTLRKKFGTKTCCLKKRKGNASLVSVEEIKKKENEPSKDKKPDPAVCCHCGCYVPCKCRGPMFICVDEIPCPGNCSNDSSCLIM